MTPDELVTRLDGLLRRWPVDIDDEPLGIGTVAHLHIDRIELQGWQCIGSDSFYGAVDGVGGDVQCAGFTDEDGELVIWEFSKEFAYSRGQRVTEANNIKSDNPHRFLDAVANHTDEASS